MNIEVTKTEQAVLASISGEITARNEQKAITDFVTEQLERGERLFLLDLSQVEYISSLGIACLAAAYVRVNGEGGKIKLISPSRGVARVLDLTRVGDVFKTYDDVDDALHSEQGEEARE